MSAKFRRQQQKKRWSDSGTVFTDNFISSVKYLSRHEFKEVVVFCKEFLVLSSHSSTFKEIPQLAILNTAFNALWTSMSEKIENEGEFCEISSEAMRLYVEIIFLENSRPLHRSLLANLGKLKHHRDIINDSIYYLCQEYSLNGSKYRKFGLVSPGISLVASQFQKTMEEAVQRCALTLAQALTRDISDAMAAVQQGHRLSPNRMEECQEALSTLYYLLQRFSTQFLEDHELQTYAGAVQALLLVLQSGSLTQDCSVAAAVGLCTAAQFGGQSSQQLALLFAQSFFSGSLEASSLTSSPVFSVSDLSLDSDDVPIRKVLGSSGLEEEVSKFQDFSKICLLRGLLTSASREVLLCPISCQNQNGNDKETGPPEAQLTLLLDGIFPALCSFCEASPDGHFKFHAATGLQICLHQIKAAGEARGESLLPAGAISRVLDLVWNNWEDPLNQTVKQIHAVFDLLLDLIDSEEGCQEAESVNVNGQHQELTLAEESDLHMPPVDELDAEQPWTGKSSAEEGNQKKLVNSLLLRITEDLLAAGGGRKGRYLPLATVSSRVGSKKLLEHQGSILQQSVLAMADDGLCCAVTSFLKPFLGTLRDECQASEGGSQSGDKEWRKIWLPAVTGPLVTGNRRLRSNVTTYVLPLLLQMDRDSLAPLLGYIQGLSSLQGHGFGDSEIVGIVSVLKAARSLDLLPEPLDTLFSDPGDHDIPNRAAGIRLPVKVLEMAVQHPDPGFRADAVEILALNPRGTAMPGRLELRLLQLALPLNLRCSSVAFRMRWTSLIRRFFFRVKNALARARNYPGDSTGSSPEEVDAFFRWLTGLLGRSLYPGAPYERKIMAMDLYSALLDTWKPAEGTRVSGDPGEDLKQLWLYEEAPVSPWLLSSEGSLSLLSAMVDSWDRLREGGFKLLCQYPTPLPALESPEQVTRTLEWATLLVQSPRVREADSGALVLRLLFRKYGVQAGWHLGIFPECSSRQPSPGSVSSGPFFLSSLCDWLESVVARAEVDMVGACASSLAHGVLLTWRYCVEEVHWTETRNSLSLHCVLHRLLALLLRVTELVLEVLSVDALNLPQAADEPAGGQTEAQEADEEEGEEEQLAPKEQMVMVACWLSMKEVSLLLGTLARVVPLPEDLHGRESILDTEQLQAMGSHFLRVLLSMKHNGAVDKTREGFRALCDRLLRAQSKDLTSLPDKWLTQLISHVMAEGQTLEKLLRRSAGLPAAFLALFLAEPSGAPRRLLTRGMTCLLDSLETLIHKQDFQAGDVVPTVHIFNILRVCFHDTDLASATWAFCARGCQLATLSFHSRHWEVRNAASLALAAIIRRMLGFLNPSQQSSSSSSAGGSIDGRRAVTGTEFFHRYPSLHPFLLDQLQSASSSSPSLPPLLVLLSRLQPSKIQTKQKDWLSPSALAPPVVLCSSHVSLPLRVLSARALPALVPLGDVPSTLLQLVHSLPLDTTHPHSNIRPNEIHGCLLQMRSLLGSYSEPRGTGKLGALLATQLGLRAWLGQPLLCGCPFVCREFLSLCCQVIEFAPLEERNTAAFFEFAALTEWLALQCLDFRGKEQWQGWDSTTVLLRQGAVAVFFTCVLVLAEGGDGDRAGKALLRMRGLLEDSMEEVRLEMLRMLKRRFLKVKQGQGESSIDLRMAQELEPALLKRMEAEDHPLVTRKLLKVLFLLATSKVVPGVSKANVASDLDSALAQWNRVLTIFDQSRHSKTKDSALKYLGVCFRNLLPFLAASLAAADAEQWGRFEGVLTKWLSLLTELSEASQLVTLRRAVAEAISASDCLALSTLARSLIGRFEGFICQSEDTSTLQEWARSSAVCRVVFDVWIVCLKLLEDEDESLRAQLSRNVQEVMEFGDQEGSRAGFVASQEEVVLCSCFEHLSAVFGGWEPLLDRFAEWIYGSESLGEVNGSRKVVELDFDLVKKLFDKEIDNHHEEQFYFVQLCCLHLQRMLKGTRREGAMAEKFLEAARKWRARFLSRLELCVWFVEQSEARIKWVGGVTFHQDAFKLLYRALTGTVTFCCGNEGLEMEQKLLLASLLERLCQVPLHPLIMELAAEAIELYELDSSILPSHALAGRESPRQSASLFLLQQQV